LLGNRLPERLMLAAPGKRSSNPFQMAVYAIHAVGNEFQRMDLTFAMVTCRRHPTGCSAALSFGHPCLSLAF